MLGTIRALESVIADPRKPLAFGSPELCYLAGKIAGYVLAHEHDGRAIAQMIAALAYGALAGKTWKRLAKALWKTKGPGF